METSNDYTKEEDKMMWELHEVRHEIIERILTEGAKKINDEAKEFYLEWRRKKSNATLSA